MITRHSISMLSLTAALSLGGFACTHHHHHRDEDAVIIDRGPTNEIFYDEDGQAIRDPAVIERVRYYDAAPDAIEQRDGVYYFRGEPVRDRSEIRALELARLHERNRQIKDDRYARDRATKDKRAEYDRAEKQKREEHDRAEKGKRVELDRGEKQKREELDRAETQKREEADRAEKLRREEAERRDREAGEK